MNINSVQLGGNLCRDPEIKYSAAGTAICTIDIANNRGYTTKTGEKKNETSFIPCTLFARSAELVSETFKKGDRILIEGRMSQETWESKDGQKRSRIKIVANNFHFVERARDQPGYEPPATATPPPQPSASVPKPHLGAPLTGDDVPF